jgi:hypothetical protein
VPKSSTRSNIPPMIYASHIALVSSIYEPYICLREERCDTFMEDDVDSMVATNGRTLEYRDRVVGYSHTKGVDHDVTLASRLSRD